MTGRRIDGFFYGLFMDSDILRENKVVSVSPRRAYVDGYELCIGRRATLVPAPNARTYGVVFALTHDDFETLYAAPGLEQYRPEAILAHSLDNETMPVLCYNLREASGTDEANTEYAVRLREVLGKLEFPPDYIESIS